MAQYPRGTHVYPNKERIEEESMAKSPKHEMREHKESCFRGDPTKCGEPNP